MREQLAWIPVMIAGLALAAQGSASAQTKTPLPSTVRGPDQATCKAYEQLLDGGLKDLASKGLAMNVRSAVQASQLELEKLNIRQAMSMQLQHMAMLGCQPPAVVLSESEYFRAALTCAAASSDADRKQSCDQSNWVKGFKEPAAK